MSPSRKVRVYVERVGSCVLLLAWLLLAVFA